MSVHQTEQDRATTRYEAIVIGAGQAGPGVAAALAEHGPVALVEMAQVGGTCLNHGCKPWWPTRRAGPPTSASTPAR
jgi:pyruvate/2-oxoglutarate dehydrogenase complex dihydrolipoamide dehydrogenase (E3) component